MRAFLTDALGSTLALTDGAGFEQTSYTYALFGDTTVSGSPSANASQFTGRENDATGPYYYRARYHSPALQRLVSEDPIGLAAGDTNLHAYAANRPTGFVDPKGEIAVPLLLCAAGVGGSAFAEWMGGRKFDPIKAAAWCTFGLTLGVGGPAIAVTLGYGSGAGVGGGAAGAAAAAGARTRPKSLLEQLALEEAMAGAGERIMGNAEFVNVLEEAQRSWER